MESYTPGYSASVTAFMERRTLSSHGKFFQPFLWPGSRVLDCGCGPGTMTTGIAGRVGLRGSVAGLDANPSQIEAARQHLRLHSNVELHTGSVYQLPFDDASFDVVVSHALVEHLADPSAALGEFRRVLRPGGVVALRSPDWDGKLVGSPTAGVVEAFDSYAGLQASNGGNLRIGKHLPALLLQVNFQQVSAQASYECYEPVSVIAEYIALQLEPVHAGHARSLRAWSAWDGSFFAQAWCEAAARKPLE